MNQSASGAELVSSSKASYLPCRRDQHPARMFCETCRELVCYDCIESDAHYSHTLVSAQRGEQALRGVVDELMEKVGQEYTALTRAIEGIRKTCKGVDSWLARQVGDIDATAEKLIAAIQQMRLNAITLLLRKASGTQPSPDVPISSKLEKNRAEAGESLREVKLGGQIPLSH